MEVWGEDGTGHTSPSSCPPNVVRGSDLSTVEKQTLEFHGHPQASFELAYHPIMAKASPQASHHVPCCTTNEGSGSTSTMRQQHLSENSRFNSSLAESSAKGKHLWSARCLQDAGTLGLGQKPCPPAKAEVASESKWEFYQHSCEPGAQALSAHGAQKLFQSSGGQDAGTAGWYLLTEGRPSIEEVSHHLTLALDLDHTPALQLVCVGGQHLVHICSNLRRHRKGEDRLSVTFSMICCGHIYLCVPMLCCCPDMRAGKALHHWLLGTMRGSSVEWQVPRDLSLKCYLEPPEELALVSFRLFIGNYYGHAQGSRNVYCPPVVTVNK